MPVTPWGSSSSSPAMQLSRPCTRAMPSATEDRADLREAPPCGPRALDALEDAVISSGLILGWTLLLSR